MNLSPLTFFALAFAVAALGGFASALLPTLKERDGQDRPKPLTLRTVLELFSVSLMTGCTGGTIALAAWGWFQTEDGGFPLWLPPLVMAAAMLIGLRGPGSVTSIWYAVMGYIANTYGADSREPDRRWRDDRGRHGGSRGRNRHDDYEEPEIDPRIWETEEEEGTWENDGGQNGDEDR